jgi:hypothetical protein
MLAGAHLFAIILFWLIAWIPMAIFCLLAFAVSPMLPNRSRPGHRRTFEFPH